MTDKTIKDINKDFVEWADDYVDMPKAQDDFDYYEAPDQEVFDEIKKASIEIWNTYDNQFGYVDEKVNRIKDLENVRDNAWYMVAMFDSVNQAKLLNLVSDRTAELIMKARGY